MNHSKNIIDTANCRLFLLFIAGMILVELFIIMKYSMGPASSPRLQLSVATQIEKNLQLT